jgi:hypothetical protein
VSVRGRVVDAAYLAPTIPATSPPPFGVAHDARVVRRRPTRRRSRRPTVARRPPPDRQPRPGSSSDDAVPDGWIVVRRGERRGVPPLPGPEDPRVPGGQSRLRVVAEGPFREYRRDQPRQGLSRFEPVAVTVLPTMRRVPGDDDYAGGVACKASKHGCWPAWLSGPTPRAAAPVRAGPRRASPAPSARRRRRRGGHRGRSRCVRGAAWSRAPRRPGSSRASSCR